jgi:hypothetical protein
LKDGDKDGRERKEEGDELRPTLSLSPMTMAMSAKYKDEEEEGKMEAVVCIDWADGA